MWFVYRFQEQFEVEGGVRGGGNAFLFVQSSPVDLLLYLKWRWVIKLRMIRSQVDTNAQRVD